MKEEFKEMRQRMDEMSDVFRSCRQEMEAVGVLCQEGMKEKESGLRKRGWPIWFRRHVLLRKRQPRSENSLAYVDTFPLRQNMLRLE